MRYPIVLFDLDGTLTNPGLGITNSVMYSLEKYGIEGQSRESLYRFIGPPLHESYEKFYSFSREQAMQAVSYYREYYEEKGMFENEVYPGIKELLCGLTKQGVLCLVATSKPEIYAKKILDYYELSNYFYYIAGANMDGTRTDKAEVIAYALKQIPAEYNNKKILMVGDRSHDIIGAKKNGIDAAGVLFGYGSREELEEAGADFIADSVEAVRNIILLDTAMN